MPVIGIEPIPFLKRTDFKSVVYTIPPNRRHLLFFFNKYL